MSKLNVCQVLLCDKKESKDHIGTLCKYHAEKLERAMGYIDGTHVGFIGSDPLKYKTINKKNSVWENGIEHVRAIQIPMINHWIKSKESKKKTLLEMVDILNEEIDKIDSKLEDLQKTKNSRYSR